MAVQVVYAVLILVHLWTCCSAFYNPILAKGQDPSVKYYNGNYYLTQSCSDSIIVVIKSAKLENLGSPDENVTVWTSSPPLCCGIWAPELYHDDVTTKWYIYFAGDDGNTEHHRSFVLESVGSDPIGPYNFLGKMPTTPTDMYAIDSTVMKLNNQLYYIWSGSPDVAHSEQNLYIATMSSPTNLSSDRFLLSEPTNPWEKTADGFGVNEGPAVLQANGSTYVAYSASSTGEDTYCLGLLTYTGGDPLQQSSWVKSNGCVFAMDASKSVYGTGHNCFLNSPDQTQVWNVYHAYDTSGAGMSYRNIRAQLVNWNVDGTPNFGTPVGYSDWVDPPSGE